MTLCRRARAGLLIFGFVDSISALGRFPGEEQLLLQDSVTLKRAYSPYTSLG